MDNISNFCFLSELNVYLLAEVIKYLKVSDVFSLLEIGNKRLKYLLLNGGIPILSESMIHLFSESRNIKKLYLVARLPEYLHPRAENQFWFNTLNTLSINSLSVLLLQDFPPTILNAGKYVSTLEFRHDIQGPFQVGKNTIWQTKILRAFPRLTHLSFTSGSIFPGDWTLFTQLQTLKLLHGLGDSTHLKIPTSVTVLQLKGTNEFITKLPTSMISWVHLQKLSLENCHEIFNFDFFPTSLTDLSISINYKYNKQPDVSIMSLKHLLNLTQLKFLIPKYSDIYTYDLPSNLKWLYITNGNFLWDSILDTVVCDLTNFRMSNKSIRNLEFNKILYSTQNCNELIHAVQTIKGLETITFHSLTESCMKVHEIEIAMGVLFRTKNMDGNPIRFFFCPLFNTNELSYQIFNKYTQDFGYYEIKGYELSPLSNICAKLTKLSFTIDIEMNQFIKNLVNCIHLEKVYITVNDGTPSEIIHYTIDALPPCIKYLYMYFHNNKSHVPLELNRPNLTNLTKIKFEDMSLPMSLPPSVTKATLNSQNMLSGIRLLVNQAYAFLARQSNSSKPNNLYPPYNESIHSINYKVFLESNLATLNSPLTDLKHLFINFYLGEIIQFNESEEVAKYAISFGLNKMDPFILSTPPFHIPRDAKTSQPVEKLLGPLLFALFPNLETIHVAQANYGKIASLHAFYHTIQHLRPPTAKPVRIFVKNKIVNTPLELVIQFMQSPKYNGNYPNKLLLSHNGQIHAPIYPDLPHTSMCVWTYYPPAIALNAPIPDKFTDISIEHASDKFNLEFLPTSVTSVYLGGDSLKQGLTSITFLNKSKLPPAIQWPHTPNLTILSISNVLLGKGSYVNIKLPVTLVRLEFTCDTSTDYNFIVPLKNLNHLGIICFSYNDENLKSTLIQCSTISSLKLISKITRVTTSWPRIESALLPQIQSLDLSNWVIIRMENISTLPLHLQSLKLLIALTDSQIDNTIKLIEEISALPIPDIQIFEIKTMAIENVQIGIAQFILEEIRNNPTTYTQTIFPMILATKKETFRIER